MWIHTNNTTESVVIARRSICFRHEGSQQRCDSNGDTFLSKRDSFINAFFDWDHKNVLFTPTSE